MMKDGSKRRPIALGSGLYDGGVDLERFRRYHRRMARRYMCVAAVMAVVAFLLFAAAMSYDDRMSAYHWCCAVGCIVIGIMSVVFLCASWIESLRKDRERSNDDGWWSPFF